MKKFGIWLIMVIGYFVVMGNVVDSIDKFSNGMIATLYVFIPLVGFPFLIGTISSFAEQKGREKEIKKKLEKEHFVTSFEISKDNGIKIDTENKQLCLIINKYKLKSFSANPSVKFETKLIPYSHVLSSKIIEDGETITNASTKTTSMAGRALVGGLLFGGVGAIIGGVTAKSSSKSKNTLKKLELEMIIDDPSYPVHRINFFNMDSGVESGSLVGKHAREEVCYWQLLLEYIMMGEEIPDHKSFEELNDYTKMVRAKREKTKGQ